MRVPPCLPPSSRFPPCTLRRTSSAMLSSHAVTLAIPSAETLSADIAPMRPLVGNSPDSADVITIPTGPCGKRTWSRLHTTLLSLLLLVGTACHSASSSPTNPIPETPRLPSVDPLPHLPTPLVLGIVPFDVHSASTALRWLSHGLPELLTTELSAAGTVTILDHARLALIQRELLRQHQGATADQSLVHVGRQLGTTVLLTGTILPLTEDMIRIDLHLTSVETGAVLTSLSRTTPLPDLLTTEHELALTLLTLLHAVPPPSALALWAPPHPIRLDALQAYHEGTEALSDHQETQARQALTHALTIDPTFTAAETALADPRLAGLAPVRWDAPTITTTPLTQDSSTTLDHLLADLLTDGLRIDLDTSRVHATGRLTLTATLNGTWVDRFSEALPLLSLEPFRRADHDHRPIRVLTAGSALTPLTTTLSGLAVILTVTARTQEPLGRLAVCLANGTYPDSPLLVRTFPTPRVALQASRPFSIPLPVTPGFWPLIAQITTTLEWNFSACTPRRP